MSYVMKTAFQRGSSLLALPAIVFQKLLKR